MSSRELLSISEDEDVKGLMKALQPSPRDGLISAPRPGVVTVQGLVVVKPAPARDSSMKSSAKLAVSSEDTGAQNPIVRVGSFLSNLLGLEDDARANDAATSESLRESQGATALQKAEAIWRKEVIPNWESLLKRGKLNQLVLKGIPPAVRGEVWKKMLGNRLGLTVENFGPIRGLETNNVWSYSSFFFFPQILLFLKPRVLDLLKCIG